MRFTYQQFDLFVYYKNLPLFLMNDCRRNYFSDGSGNYATSIPIPSDAYQK